MTDLKRNFYAEALAIHQGLTMMVPEKAHLEAVIARMVDLEARMEELRAHIGGERDFLGIMAEVSADARMNFRKAVPLVGTMHGNAVTLELPKNVCSIELFIGGAVSASTPSPTAAESDYMGGEL